MDANGSFLGLRVTEEGPSADIALAPTAQFAHSELVMTRGQCAGAETAKPDLPAETEDDDHDKFGVEEHALNDFRDYGLD